MWKRGLLVAAVTFAGGAGGSGDVERVTTDSRVYCHMLASILDHTPTSEEARAMKEDGVQRCARGDTRDGITQLRRALLLSREDPR
jgi:hypothetical protein